VAKRSDQGAGKTPDFSAVVNALPGMVWTTRADGRSDFVNRTWQEYTGLSSDDALGQGWQKALHPDDLSSFLDSWSAIKQSGVAREIDARLRRFDGEYRWFVLNAAPIPETRGANRQWCWLGVYADEGPSLDGRLRRFFDILPWQAGFVNRAGVSEFSNRQALRDFNMTQEELAQWTTSGIVHVDDHERNHKAATALLATGELFDEQIRMLYPTGVYRWTRAR
jgi:PAS domain S-box-containing protein